jgi:predicted acetyltransferase
VIDRPDAMWASRTRNPSGDTRWAVLGDDPPAEAYAAYRVTGGWGDFGPENSMLITELVAPTTDGYLGMFRFLLDHDLVGPITAALRPADELLPLILADQRRLARTSLEGMWVRLVDVPAALSGRRYAGSGHLVLDVADPFSPSNSGRWALDAGPAGAACQPSREPSDLSLSVSALAMAYLGGTPFTDLVRAGRAREDRPGAALAASRLFASDPLPWAPTFF